LIQAWGFVNGFKLSSSSRESRWIKILLLTVAASFIIGFGAFAYVSKSTSKGGQDGRTRSGSPRWTRAHRLAAMSSAGVIWKTATKRCSATRPTRCCPDRSAEQALNQMINERVIEILAKQLTGRFRHELARTSTAFPLSGERSLRSAALHSVAHRNRMTPSEFEAEQRRELLSNKCGTDLLHGEGFGRRSLRGMAGPQRQGQPEFRQAAAKQSSRDHFTTRSQSALRGEQR
jgi:hypothetical protein